MGQASPATDQSQLDERLEAIANSQHQGHLFSERNPSPPGRRGDCEKYRCNKTFRTIGSSPPEKPPGSMTIWLFSISLSQPSNGILNGCRRKVADNRQSAPEHPRAGRNPQNHTHSWCPEILGSPTRGVATFNLAFTAARSLIERHIHRKASLGNFCREDFSKGSRNAFSHAFRLTLTP